MPVAEILAEISKPPVFYSIPSINASAIAAEFNQILMDSGFRELMVDTFFQPSPLWTHLVGKQGLRQDLGGRVRAHGLN